MRPKLYKEGNTDRPVIRSVNCHTAKILQYIDHSLQPHVQELGSYVKDSTDFTKKKYPQLTKYHKKAFSDMDVRSLCTNISNNEGIKAVETTLKWKNLPTKAIISFLKLILTLSNFVFNSTNFLQIKGCAMGKKCALTYASISPSMKLIFLRWGGLPTTKFQPECVNEESSTERRSLSCQVNRYPQTYAKTWVNTD